MSGCMRDLVKVVARSSTAFRSTAADRDVFVIEFAFTIERWRGREKKKKRNNTGVYLTDYFQDSSLSLR